MLHALDTLYCCYHCTLLWEIGGCCCCCCQRIAFYHSSSFPLVESRDRTLPDRPARAARAVARAAKGCDGWPFALKRWTPVRRAATSPLEFGRRWRRHTELSLHGSMDSRTTTDNGAARSLNGSAATAPTAGREEVEESGGVGRGVLQNGEPLQDTCTTDRDEDGQKRAHCSLPSALRLFL